LSDPVIDLLQTLIRNECVNDGSASSGHEERSVHTLTEFFGVEGIVVEPSEGRQSLVYRIQGTDPTSPSLAFVPHLDVVPANESAWTVDPFSAEIKDGFVYGRGAIDMLNIVASMAVAFKPYLTGEKRARGDLVFCAVADEEGGGRFGAHRLVRDHWPLVEASYVLTEVAYPGLQRESGRSVPVSVGEKGSYFTKLKFFGTAGHGSAPYGADSAAERMIEALQGIIDTNTPVQITEEWPGFAEMLGLDAEILEALSDPGRIDVAIDLVAEDDPLLARYIHAATHLTISTNYVRSGNKANIIADRATAVLDIRTMPGMDRGFVDNHLLESMGSGRDGVEIVAVSNDESSVSSIETPLWEAIRDSVDAVEGHRNLVPVLATVATDARFWRRRGAVVYGVGIYDDATAFSEMSSLFHGDDERVSIESVLRTTSLYESILKQFGEHSQ
jgi:acetylornithine deacetylase/succinyl-diaminopimelate desuccinylase-like protein